MDFGKVLGGAWEITWRWKMLWVLGFLAGLGQVAGVSQSSYNYSGDEFNSFRWTPTVPLDEFFAAVTAVIIAIICILLIIVIIIWVVSVIARGGLIASVQQIEDEGTTTFSRAWAAGVKKFWTLFGLSLLSPLSLLVLFFIGGVFAFFLVTVSIGLMDSSEAVEIFSTLLAILCSGFLCCGLIILAVVLEQIRIYGERAAILEDLGWIDAFVRGWQVLKKNLGATIILWLIFFALGIVLFGISFGIVFALVAPLLGLFIVSEPGYWIFAPICIGGLLGVIIFALVRSIVTAFTSSTWTMAYRQMTMQEDVELIPVGESD